MRLLRVPSRALPAFLVLAHAANAERRVALTYSEVARQVNEKAAKLAAEDDDKPVDDTTSDRSIRRACNTLRRAGFLTKVRDTASAVEWEIPPEHFPFSNSHGYHNVREDMLCVISGPSSKSGQSANNDSVNATLGTTSKGPSATSDHSKHGPPTSQSDDGPKVDTDGSQKVVKSGPTAPPAPPISKQIPSPLPIRTVLEESGGAGEEKNRAQDQGEGIDVARSLELLQSAGVNSRTHREQIASSVPASVIAFAIAKAAKSKLGVGAWVKWLTDSREVISLRDEARQQASKRQAASLPAQHARKAVEKAAQDEAKAKADADLIRGTDGHTLLATAKRLIDEPPNDFPERMRSGLIRGLHGCGPSHPGVIRACVTHGRGWLADLIRKNNADGVQPVMAE